jgi:hypothetical protein
MHAFDMIADFIYCNIFLAFWTFDWRMEAFDLVFLNIGLVRFEIAAFK